MAREPKPARRRGDGMLKGMNAELSPLSPTQQMVLVSLRRHGPGLLGDVLSRVGMSKAVTLSRRADVDRLIASGHLSVSRAVGRNHVEGRIYAITKTGEELAERLSPLVDPDHRDS